ncbi:MAG: hypothetical protein OHK0056_11360 [Bacteriovoracaceae bacterium]
MGQRVLETFKRSDVPAELLKSPNLTLLTKDLIVDYFIIIVSMIALFNTHEYLYPLWIMIIAGRFHALGVILHDLSHLNLKNKSWQFRILEIFSGYPIGTSANAMAYHHLRHHRHTLMNQDPYFNINKKCTGFKRFLLTFKKGLFFVPFWITRSFVGLFASFIPGLRTFYARVFLQDVSGQNLSRDSEVISCAKEDIPLAFCHLLLIFLSTRFDFLLYSYYAALPIAGIFCIYRLLIEHEYDIYPNKNVYTLLESTFDHHTGLWGKFFFGPHKIGHHCMHHIHPNVGLHYLPRLRQWYLQNCSFYQDSYEEQKFAS